MSSTNLLHGFILLSHRAHVSRSSKTQEKKELSEDEIPETGNTNHCLLDANSTTFDRFSKELQLRELRSRNIYLLLENPPLSERRMLVYCHGPNFRHHLRLPPCQPTISLTQTTFLRNITLDIATSFLIRIIYPLSTKIGLLNLRIGYLPQYIASYALGASLAEPTFSKPPSKKVRDILIASSAASTATTLGILHFRPATHWSSSEGGPNMPALCYAVFNESTGYLPGSSIWNLFKTTK